MESGKIYPVFVTLTIFNFLIIQYFMSGSGIVSMLPSPLTLTMKLLGFDS